MDSDIFLSSYYFSYNKTPEGSHNTYSVIILFLPYFLINIHKYVLQKKSGMIYSNHFRMNILTATRMGVPNVLK